MPGKNLGDIAAVNAKYYSSKGKAIYSDFSTFAQGKALATANAIEFVHEFSKAISYYSQKSSRDFLK